LHDSHLFAIRCTWTKTRFIRNSLIWWRTSCTPEMWTLSWRCLWNLPKTRRERSYWSLPVRIQTGRDTGKADTHRDRGGGEAGRAVALPLFCLGWILGLQKTYIIYEFYIFYHFYHIAYALREVLAGLRGPCLKRDHLEPKFNAHVRVHFLNLPKSYSALRYSKFLRRGSGEKENELKK